jgi:methionine-rich copper-binding protein CopC
MVRLAAAIALLLACAGAASAHAMLERASPRVGTKVAVSPSDIRLWFSEGLEANFSRATLFDAAGNPVRVGTMRVEGRQLVLPLPRPLGPGRYRVRWTVVSVDSHRTEGDFTFDVGP